jgi:hypothetical protein
MGNLPKIPPCDPCIACFRGDVVTGFAVAGSLEWFAVALMNLGLPEDQAIATAQANGTDDPDMPTLVRLCPDCAARTDAWIAPLDGDEIPVYREPMQGAS